MEFAIDIVSEPPRTVLAVQGDLDLATADQLVDAVSAVLSAGQDAAGQDAAGQDGSQAGSADDLGSGPALVVDLTRVDFVDSSGLGALARTRRLVLAVGGELTVRVATDPVRRLLALTHMDTVLGVEDLGRPADPVPVPTQLTPGGSAGTAPAR